MKKIILLLSAILVGILSFGQSHLHSGKNDGTTTLFDSGGVVLSVREYNFDSCGSSKRQVYKCLFTFKNNNSFPIILKKSNFYTDNATDSAGRIGCAISRVGVSVKPDTLAPNSTKTVDVYGETQGLYQPAGTPVNKGCTYHWTFTGFMPFKK